MENRADYLLESYFSNALTPAEAGELNTLISSDAGVAAEFAFQKRIAASLQSSSLAGGIQNKSWKSAAQASSAAPAMTVRVFPKYALAAAAALALLIVAYLFLMPPANLDTVLAENTIEYPNKMKFKSLGEEAEVVPENVIRAFGLYDEHDFSGAARALEPIVAANPERIDFRFYWGVSLVKSKQYKQAVAALTPIAQSQDERKIPAQYYLGLACAGASDKACAEQNLKAYIDSKDGVTYRKQAKAVLDAL